MIILIRIDLIDVDSLYVAYILPKIKPLDDIKNIIWTSHNIKTIILFLSVLLVLSVFFGQKEIYCGVTIFNYSYLNVVYC